MGCNSFSSTILTLIYRSHSSVDALHATTTVKKTMHEVMAAEAGIKSIYSTWITLSILSIYELIKLGNDTVIRKVLLIASIG